MECLIFIYHHHCYVVPVMNEIRFWTNCSRQHFFHFLLRKGLTWQEQEGKSSFTTLWCFSFSFHYQLHCHGTPQAPSCRSPWGREPPAMTVQGLREHAAAPRAELGLTLPCRCHSSSNPGIDHSSQNSRGHQGSINKADYLLKLKLLKLPRSNLSPGSLIFS